MHWKQRLSVDTFVGIEQRLLDVLDCRNVNLIVRQGGVLR